MSQTDDAESLQGAVLAWLDADPSRGYRRAAREFGVPAATVKGWAQAHRAGRALPRPNARTGARAREEAADEEPLPEDEPTWDATACTREQFLEHRLRFCLTASRRAEQRKNGGVARQWEVTAGSYRDELDHLREEERRRQEARGRTAEVSPEELATRLLRAIPGVARMAPELAREMWLELGRAIGEWGE